MYTQVMITNVVPPLYGSHAVYSQKSQYTMQAPTTAIRSHKQRQPP